MAELSSKISVRVREYPVLADIGINPDEVGRRQPLVVSVVLELASPKVTEIGDTVDYRKIVAAIDKLAELHIPLIETFAYQLAERCLEMPQAVTATVSIDKPFAIMRGTAGTEVCLSRT